MEFNTNPFNRPTELVHSSVDPHTHWAVVKFTSQRDRVTMLMVDSMNNYNLKMHMYAYDWLVNVQGYS